MSKNTPKEAAASLLRKYPSKRPGLDDIVTMITDCGYDVIDFDLSERTASSTILINRLGLTRPLSSQPALTCRKGDLQIVFIDAGLDASGKLYALSHELGHIACGHLSSKSTGEYSVAEEYEANEFAHYLLNPGGLNAFRYWAKKYLIATVGILLLLVAVFFCGMAVRNALNAPQRSLASAQPVYYVTDGGTRYHEENCITLRDKTNIHIMTEEEFNSGRYSPCQVCLP